MKNKKADVAGLFYPAEPEELKGMLETFINNAKPANHLTRAVIAPHAGYIYSGPIAGSAYRALYSSKESIKNVVIMSPSHNGSFDGVATHSAQTFSTPLGEIEVNQDLKTQISSLPFVKELDEAFIREHALEVHLPFIHFILPHAKILPLIVGHTYPEEIQMLIETLWNDPANAFVISSDLSHFLSYVQAQKLDSLTAKQIERMLYQEIHHEQCCGFFPVRGMLKFAKEHGLKISKLDLRNSADTAGEKGRVVGYGSFMIHN